MEGEQAEILKVLERGGSLCKLGLTDSSNAEEQSLAVKWAALTSYLPNDTEAIEESVVRHVEYTLAQTRPNLTPYWYFKACSLSVRDRLLERWKDTQTHFFEKDCKRVAYLSLEFLIGRSLQNSILNTEQPAPQPQRLISPHEFPHL